MSCDSTNTCNGAADLGTLSGDTNADTAQAQAYTEKWFRVRVTEDDSGMFSPSTLDLRASLTSPQGVNFDLYMYIDKDADNVECSMIGASSTSSSTLDIATLQWGETGLFPNGDDDGRYVNIEIRHVSGDCDPGKTWKLVLEGN